MTRRRPGSPGTESAEDSDSHAAPEVNWRLLVSGCGDGALNMAVDEALLHTAMGGGQPVLRLYAWSPAAVSLGFFQELDDTSINRAEIQRRGFGLVRRPTGGRAILHKHEITYSVAARQSDIGGGNTLMGAYRSISRGVEAGLNLLGIGAALAEKAGGSDLDRSSLPTVCFGHPARADMVAAGRKIVGSAQLRRREALLQHGAIPISIDPAEHLAVMPGGLGNAEADAADAGRLARIACGVADIIGREPSFSELADAIAEGFRRALGIEFEPGGLSAAETDLADRLRTGKYLNPEWTLHRRDPLA